MYLGHKDKVRSISIDPTGQWLASGLLQRDSVLYSLCIPCAVFISVCVFGADFLLVCVSTCALGSLDKTVRLWEISTARCVKVFLFNCLARLLLLDAYFPK